MNGNTNNKMRKTIFTIVELVIVGMEEFLPVFIPCEVLNFLPEVFACPTYES